MLDRPVHAAQEGLGQKHLAIGPVEHVEEAVAIGVQQQLGGLAFVNGVDQYVGLGGVAILHDRAA